jgi:hypothetical protein
MKGRGSRKIFSFFGYRFRHGKRGEDLRAEYASIRRYHQCTFCTNVPDPFRRDYPL